MRIETKHLIIRSLALTDEAVRTFTAYFFRHYDADTLFATASANNKSSCRTLENAGFALLETKIYQDMYDEKAKLYNFYEMKKAKTND